MQATASSPEQTTDLPELVFDTGLLGFPDAHRFVLVGLDDDGCVFELRSVDDPDLGFVAVAPGAFFPDYAPELDEPTVQHLGLSGADDALLLAIVTLGGEDTAGAANLLAPVVVNRHSRQACQAVLTGQDHPLRADLPVG